MADSKDTGTDSKFSYKSYLNSADTKELKGFLEKRLIDCGWRKDIEEMIRKKMMEGDSANISREELAKSIIPNARAMVPNEVREEMMLRVREVLEAPVAAPNDKEQNSDGGIV
ncbi:enhancer of yellow 2b transcription factor [Drosophila navojoa]|nr:enhancer of yellow 2b transcription factor [Drosophila navojoa]